MNIERRKIYLKENINILRIIRENIVSTIQEQDTMFCFCFCFNLEHERAVGKLLKNLKSNQKNPKEEFVLKIVGLFKKNKRTKKGIIGKQK